MKSKAIGLRIPAALWEQVSNYGCENFPKPDSEGGKDFDITSTLLELINKGLGNDSVEQPDKQTVEQIVKDLVSQTVEQPVKQVDQQSVEQVVKQCVELQLNEVLDDLKNSIDTEQQIEKAIADLKIELQPILESHKEFETLLEKALSLVSELEQQKTRLNLSTKETAPIVNKTECSDSKTTKKIRTSQREEATSQRVSSQKRENEPEATSLPSIDDRHIEVAYVAHRATDCPKDNSELRSVAERRPPSTALVKAVNQPKINGVGQLANLEQAFAIALDAGYDSKRESFRNLLNRRKKWQSPDGRIEISYRKRKDRMNYLIDEILD